MKKRSFILASRSPRRIAFLKALRMSFLIRPVDVSEARHKGESPRRYLERITRLKMATAKSRTPLKHKHKRPLIVADTIVILGKSIIGKPRSRTEAGRMLRRLSGKKHVVWTMVRIFDPVHTPNERRFLTKTAVTFDTISKNALNAYLRSNEWKDKAGAYAVQGLGSVFVLKIDGPLSNVIGFPLNEFLIEAERLNLL